MKNTFRHTLLTLLIVVAAAITSCSKDDIPQPQTVPAIVSALVNITSSEATITGTLSSTGGSDIIEWGVCWGETSTPTIADHKITATVSGTGFRIVLPELDPLCTYYFRCFAVNATGIGYGNELSLVTGDLELTAREVPDDIFRQLLLEECDRNGDGKLMLSETLEIFDLYIDEKGITSLEGIRYLYHLRNFVCSGNKLTSLDLNFPFLESFECHEKNLSSLHVDDCTNLQYLDCSQSKLTSLVVKNCPKLEELYCSDNQLTELDLSMIDSLEYLSCDRNLLTSLELNHCPKLGTLYCKANQLKDLDISACPKCYYLNCEENPSLTTIFISAEQGSWLENPDESVSKWTKPEHAVYLQKPMNTLMH